MAATNKNMNFDVNLLPTTTNDHNLGSSDLKWNLFVNQINGGALVTGVKGNAETNYRTGNVNLTAANIGAVATSGNESIAGNKTFSGITSLTYNSIYSIPTNTGIGTATITKYLISNPFALDWHDLFAFCNVAVPKYYTSSDKTTWTEATLDERIFMQQTNWGGINILADGLNGSRWEWNSNGFNYGSGYWLMLGILHSANMAKFDLLFESFDSSNNVTTLCSFTNQTNNSTPYYLPLSTGISSAVKIRLTITRSSGDTATTNNLPICALKLYSPRCGNQGKGPEYEVPYNWNQNQDIFPRSNNKSNLGDLNNKWAKIYATDFYGSGSNLTSLNASNLSSGTVSTARLPVASTSAAGIIQIGTGSTNALAGNTISAGKQYFLTEYSNNQQSLDRSKIMYVPVVQYNTVTPDYTSGGEQFYKAAMKYIAETYSTTADVLIGRFVPNASGPFIGQIYDNATRDATTGLPQYSTFIFHNLNGGLESFGTYQYQYYYRKYVYTNNTTGSIGNSQLPVYVNAGAITACSEPLIRYGTSSEAAATAAKTASIANFTLTSGVTVYIKFTNVNSAASPTLNISSTGAKSITLPNGNKTPWDAGEVVSLTYDGTSWNINNYSKIEVIRL